jgi:predicted nucleic acid-binding protein
VIVVDASVLVEILLATDAGLRASDRLLRTTVSLHAPHLVDVEVLHALRGLARRREVAPQRAELAVRDFLELRIERHAHGPLVTRAWELRNAFSAYDAMYVALAEMLEAPLVTADGKLQGGHGHRARIEVP